MDVDRASNDPLRQLIRVHRKAHLACFLCASVALWLIILEAGLDAGGEGAEVAYALDFVVGELDAEMIF